MKKSENRRFSLDETPTGPKLSNKMLDRSRSRSPDVREKSKSSDGDKAQNKYIDPNAIAEVDESGSSHDVSSLERSRSLLELRKVQMSKMSTAQATKVHTP